MTTLLEPYTPPKLIVPESTPPIVHRPGDVVLSPAPAKLFAKPGAIDLVRGEENNILNTEFVRRLLQQAEEEAERERVWKLRNPRLARKFYPVIAGGAAGAWTLTNELRIILQGATGAIVPATDSLKIALFLSTSNLAVTSTTYAALTNEHANANGYTTGGIASTLTVSTVSTSQGQLAFTQVQWTASSTGIVARFLVAYKVAGHIYAYALTDSTPADVTASNGNTFTVTAGNLWTLQ